MKRILQLIFIALTMISLSSCDFLVTGDEYVLQPSNTHVVNNIYTGRQDDQVRAIYVGASDNILSMLEIARDLQANAMVIDIKDETGKITCDIDVPYKKNMRIKDVRSVVRILKKNKIYTIARIVTFKDETAAEAMPDLAVKNEDGTLLLDKEGAVWLNPYNKKTWKYISDIAKGAAKIGFAEIQFDYARFSPYKNNANFGEESKHTSRVEIINQFFDFIMEELKPFNVKVSVDVFGAIIPGTLGEDTIKSVEKLGQDYVQLSKKLDVICPMIYPSHYPINSMGVKYPDLEPYSIVYKVMAKAAAASKQSKATIRPWLQAFTASWLPAHIYQRYGRIQMEQQIKAAHDAGVKQWCFWNSLSNYVR